MSVRSRQAVTMAKGKFLPVLTLMTPGLVEGVAPAGRKDAPTPR
jgi:hypothetical protein